jgi:hypothetical protein
MKKGNTLTESDKVELLVRAGYRCEYCKILLQHSYYEIEHVFPTSKGGKNIKSNFAVSCTRCNKNKSSYTEWIDPYTASTFPLFNPRVMIWEEHFKKMDREITGISPAGRATAALLFRDTSQFLPPDLEWDKIEELQGNEPIYYFLNHMRYRRLRNDFTNLFRQLTRPLPEVDMTGGERIVVNFAQKLLLLELFFTRSSNKDVDMGISSALNCLHEYRHEDRYAAEIKQILSILFQQRATIKYNKDDIKGARQDQKESYKMFLERYRGDLSISQIPHQPEKIGAYLRKISVQAKYDKLEVSNILIEKGLNLIKMLDPFYASSHYSYLIDLLLLTSKPTNKILEQMLQLVSDILETSGYGSNMDQAKLITLRRRWWGLTLILNPVGWQDIFEKDLRLWKKISMFNEIRELRSYIKRTHSLISDNNLKDSEYIFNRVDVIL